MDITSKSWSAVDSRFRASVREQVQEAQSKAVSCSVRASNELRNASLKVLQGKLNG